MKLLLDETLSPAIARELRSRFHDVESVAVRPGLSDAEVMAIARAEERAVVTGNLRDFRPLHHEAVGPGGPGHYGIVVVGPEFSRTRAGAGRVVAALEAMLGMHPGVDEIAGGEVWL